MVISIPRPKAKEELKKLGPLSRDEKITALALGLTVVLWIGGQALGVNAVAAALTGLSILLITSMCGVLCYTDDYCFC